MSRRCRRCFWRLPINGCRRTSNERRRRCSRGGSPRRWPVGGPHGVTGRFDYLATIEAVEVHVRKSSVRSATGGGALPCDVAEPGQLMAHVVWLAGSGGITQQRLLDTFEALDDERTGQGLKSMRHDGDVIEVTEERPDEDGRLRQQTVYRPRRAQGPPGSMASSSRH